MWKSIVSIFDYNTISLSIQQPLYIHLRRVFWAAVRHAGPIRVTPTGLHTSLKGCKGTTCRFHHVIFFHHN